CLTMGDSGKIEELIQELFGEIEIGAHFLDEEDDIILLEHTSLEKDKGKMVYIIDEEEVEHLDVDHSHGTREVLASVDVDAYAYHEPMKTTKVNIGTKAKPKE
ncbi:hypothetical protein KI387_011746, partial [Taxus chinensis]